MSQFESILKEVIVLGDVLYKQEFRICFLDHFTTRVKELQAVSEKIDIKILQRLQLTLLNPLFLHLRNSDSSNNKCLIIQCIIQVLKLTSVHTVAEFFDIYTVIFFQIYKHEKLLYKPSEELKEAVLECCTYLINRTSQNVLENIYNEENGAKFSLGISISVEIVKEEKSIKLRVAGLDFLLAASRYEVGFLYNKKICNKIGDLFMLYLPGILAPLLEVILRDESQHHLITVKALACWGHILCLVMKDIDIEPQTDTDIVKKWLDIKKKSEQKVPDITKGLKEKKRTKVWLESAAAALHPLILKLTNVRKHSHPSCRLELTRVMIKLLKNCLGTLKNSLPLILEVLVSSAVDENPEICEIAEKALMEFETDCLVYVSVIEENLYTVVSKLPGIIKSGNEQLILPTLKSFLGYLRILGRLGKLEHLLSLSSTLKKLIHVIIVNCELELYPEISNQDYSIWDNEMTSNQWYKPWKQYKHFADEDISTQIKEICQTLGKFSKTEAIFDFLLDIYNEDSRKEIILILNQVISGSEEIPDHVITNLLDFYLHPQNLYLPLEVDSSTCINIREARTNIVKVALIMEGIENLAANVGNRFQDHLFKALYYILEMMGSSYTIIRKAATKSANAIANACEPKGDLKFLIQNNVDYLTYHLTVKLKRNDTSVFDVLTVLMKNSSFAKLPNLEEIINRVLKTSSQNVDSKHTISYLRLFQTFVIWVNKWRETNITPPLPSTTSSSSSNQKQTIKNIDILQKYMESLEEKPPIEEDIGDSTIDEESSQEEPKKPELPRHLKLTLAVANHSLNYLASKDKDKKLIVLEILNECVWALADWENELLPLVHKIWSPLVTRFELITDPLIINRSFTLLCTLSQTSKDFIRARTLKDVIPALESFLIKESAKSKLKDSSSGYYFTQAFKLQRQLLANLGKLTSNLMLFEKQLDLVVESALPYLSSLQPRDLQENCKTLFEDLKVYDPYLVWFKVHDLAGNPEFAKNANVVLNSLK